MKDTSIRRNLHVFEDVVNLLNLAKLVNSVFQNSLNSLSLLNSLNSLISLKPKHPWSLSGTDCRFSDYLTNHTSFKAVTKLTKFSKYTKSVNPELTRRRLVSCKRVSELLTLVNLANLVNLVKLVTC